MKPRILFVGIIDSPHTARWIELIADQGWDLHFFPVYPAAPHPIMRGITIHRPWIPFQSKGIFRRLVSSYFSKSKNKDKNTLPIRSIYPIPVTPKYEHKLLGIRTKPLGESNITTQAAYGPRVLARLIKKLKPDLIHSMEFQHAGYTVLKAKEEIHRKYFPKWLATNWGSDIYYFKNFPDHEKQITRLLQAIDYYSCECHRDIKLAQGLGLVTKDPFLLTNTGGFDLEKISTLRNEIKPSSRNIIMIKGYQHFAGRALTALEALIGCIEHVKNYHIIVYSASVEIFARIEEIKSLYQLNITTYTPLQLSHDEMLVLFSKARIYLGVSISDAISTSMLEAMAMGTFPIQTNTACCDEWIEDGKTGFSIPPDNVSHITNCLNKALLDDALVDTAALLNWTTVSERLDKNIIREKEVAIYHKIFEEIGT
ncbi:glycosyltransferase [Candidatus Berkiella aquae]|uniref:Glycosyl transferases group 1 n=1 Tax=Candidatus Berkiella aquae TaxID=295108 RepID=A0A0Q9Z013_9GAMM|nr:glycosyltransferase [Candidatus Berkiella aquae]MCS5712446.1 glycosyltransferase [Candidatus Berkiella aquae]